MDDAFFRHITRGYKITAGFLIALVILLAGVSWYGYTRIAALSTQVAELTSATALLQTNITEATTTLGAAIKQERQNVQYQLGGVKDQVGSINGTVTNLQKLSKTDPELLAKYSKVFFLSENYAPARLAVMPPEYQYDEKKRLQLVPEVLSYLQKMLDQAREEEVALYAHSAYRSFNTQEALKGQYAITYGPGTANTFSADQGYSEHQLGTTVDLITKGTNGQLSGFDKTPAYAWVVANAHRYGFVLSYPQKNAYYIFEPWHWRFVGVKLATDLHNQKKNFYELDQRTIDTYLVNIFD
ncbi:MAG: M15 family metallopeptidase [Candidatus Paceibacterota bacterium]